MMFLVSYICQNTKKSNKIPDLLLLNFLRLNFEYYKAFYCPMGKGWQISVPLPFFLFKIYANSISGIGNQ